MHGNFWIDQYIVSIDSILPRENIEALNEELLKVRKGVIASATGIVSEQEISELQTFECQVQHNLDLLIHQIRDYLGCHVFYGDHPSTQSPFSPFQLSSQVQIITQVVKIYNLLLHAVYSEDDSCFSTLFEFLVSYKFLRTINFQGMSLLHHIIVSKNDELIEMLMIRFRNELHDFITSPFIFNESSFLKMFVIGGQSILHTCASSYRSIYPKLKEQCDESILSTRDCLGYTAEDYYSARGNVSFEIQNRKMLQNLFGLKFTLDEPIIVEQLRENDGIIQAIQVLLSTSGASYQQPNSMHYKGKVYGSLDAGMKELLCTLKNRFTVLDLDGKILNIYAFTAEYGEGYNSNLDKHLDSSIITININFECSEDIEGTDLHIRDLVIPPRKNQIVIHHGKIEHHVSERLKGSRKNLIIWLK